MREFRSESTEGEFSCARYDVRPQKTSVILSEGSRVASFSRYDFAEPESKDLASFTGT